MFCMQLASRIILPTLYQCSLELLFDWYSNRSFTTKRVNVGPIWQRRIFIYYQSFWYILTQIVIIVLHTTNLRKLTLLIILLLVQGRVQQSPHYLLYSLLCFILLNIFGRNHFYSFYNTKIVFKFSHYFYYITLALFLFYFFFFLLKFLFNILFI